MTSLDLDSIAIPVMPMCVVDAFSCLGADEPDARELADVIGRDPGLTARVMAVANSAMLGQGATTSDLRIAIGRLGFASMKELLVEFAVCSTLEPRFQGYDWGALWRHCAVTGQIALRLGTALHPAAASDLHMAGLLHDVGLFVLGQQHPEQAEELFKQCGRTGRFLQEVESELVLPSHGPMGAHAAAEWNFPPRVCLLIHFHEMRGGLLRPEMPREEETLVGILALADALALRCDVVPLGFRALPVNPVAFGVDLHKDAIMKIVDSAKQMVDALGGIKKR